jgi:hypothetical protein
LHPKYKDFFSKKYQLKTIKRGPCWFNLTEPLAASGMFDCHRKQSIFH